MGEKYVKLNQVRAVKSLMLWWLH